MHNGTRTAATTGLFWLCCVGVLLAQQAPPRNAQPPRGNNTAYGPVAPANYDGRAAQGPPANQNPPPAVENRPAMPRQPGPANPRQPSWYPLTPAAQKYVDEVLNYWEQSSAQVERYRCKFERYEYDPAWTLINPKTNRRHYLRYSTGTIKYARPDKGTFQVTKTLHYTQGKTQGDAPQYLEHVGEVLEHWVCNGNSVFEFDQKNKKLIEHELPPEMRGGAIIEGPLPFLFGAKAAQIKERYWVQCVTPNSKQAEGQIWLEAWPKRREDAANYRKVEIIIAHADFLPQAIQIFNYGGNDDDPNSTVLTFANREINFRLSPLGQADPLGVLNWVNTEFSEPRKPLGWTKEINRFDAASGNQSPAAATRGALRAMPQIPLRKG